MGHCKLYMPRRGLTKKEGQFLRDCRVARVATVGDRRPHCVPICPAWDGEVIYFATQANTRKLRNVRTNPKVSLVADDYFENWRRLRGLVIGGRAEVIGPGTDFRRYRQGLLRKYKQYRGEMAPDERTDVIVAIHPFEVTSWGLE